MRTLKDCSHGILASFCSLTKASSDTLGVRLPEFVLSLSSLTFSGGDFLAASCEVLSTISVEVRMISCGDFRTRSLNMNDAVLELIAFGLMADCVAVEVHLDANCTS